jgi:ComF family protein
MHVLLRALIDVVYPRHCLLTGRYLGEERTIVPEIDDAALLHHPTAPSPQELEVLLQRHFAPDDLAIASAHAVWALTPESTIDHAIHAVKYHGRTQLAEHLGAYLARLPALEELPADVLVAAVPIHTARHRERGYNQADHIVRGWMRADPRTVLRPNVIIRERYTPTQTRRSEAERLRNVSGAFAVTDSRAVRGRRVVLVDDVITTGATLNSCAMALLEAGARRVDVAALCAAL